MTGDESVPASTASSLIDRLVPASVLRARRGDEAPPVTYMELFFDLVYVFAIIQLSHVLIDHMSGRGALETTILFLAVWWAWNYSAWATNWVDPNHTSVRVMVAALMLCGVVMAAAIPDAFESGGLVFAVAYVVLQLLRSGYMVVALRGHRMGRNYAQLLAWSAIAAVPWLVGALAHGDARIAWWLVAVAIDYAAPLHGFALPRVGRTAMTDWTLAGEHLAERNRLVFIIALGETILLLGGTLVGADYTAAIVVAAVVGFVGVVLLWWLYFGYDHTRLEDERLRKAADPTRIARLGYAYAHGIMVAGVIAVAVAIEQTLAHPTDEVSTAVGAVILAGPAIYLAGNALFFRAITDRFPPSRFAGIAALAAVVPVAFVADAVVLTSIAVGVLLVLTVATGSRATTVDLQIGGSS